MTIQSAMGNLAKIISVYGVTMPDARQLARQIMSLRPDDAGQISREIALIAVQGGTSQALPPVLREAAALLAARVREGSRVDPPA